jgi:hypothetical protein
VLIARYLCKTFDVTWLRTRLWRCVGCVAVQLRELFTMAPYGGDCTPATLTPGNGTCLPQYPLSRRLRGTQECCGMSGKEKNLLTLPRIERRFLGRPAHSFFIFFFIYWARWLAPPYVLALCTSSALEVPTCTDRSRHVYDDARDL